MRVFRLAAFLLCTTPWLSACGDGDLTAARQETLIIGKSSGLSSVDPGATIMFNNFGPMALAYERLLTYEINDGIPTGAVAGELAQSWHAENDGRTWLFTLKSNHRFDDGTVVTAEAVRFSFERTLKLGLGTAQALAGLKNIEVIDDHTVRFHLADPSPIFPLILALPPMVIINPAVMAHQQNDDMARAWLSENTAGSGPYRISAWERGQRIVLHPNPYAAQQPQQFNKIVIKAVKDNASRRLLLERGNIDIFEGVSPDMVDKLSVLPGVTLFERPLPVIVAMAMNTTRPPFDNVQVRQAFSLAVDRAAIADGVVDGHASLMHGVLPEGIPGHDNTIPIVTRNLEQAKKLLAEAGIRPGTKFTLSYVPATTTIEATALALQSQLADVGIVVQLETLAPSAYAKVLQGDFDLTLSNWTPDFPDPWVVMQFAYHSTNAGEGYNLSRYANADVDRLLTAAERMMDSEQRIKLYREAQAIIVRDKPMVDLFTVHGLLAYRADLRGLKYNAWQPGIYNVWDMTRDTVEGANKQ